jgi:hypothetical protein
MDAVRYVQSHAVDTPVIQSLVECRGMGPGHDGITEAWWDSLEALQAATGTSDVQAAMRMLIEDESNFVDFARSTIFMTEFEIFAFRG